MAARGRCLLSVKKSDFWRLQGNGVLLEKNLSLFFLVESRMTKSPYQHSVGISSRLSEMKNTLSEYSLNTYLNSPEGGGLRQIGQIYFSGDRPLATFISAAPVSRRYMS